MEQLPTSPGERPEETNASDGSTYTATATLSEQGLVTEWSEDARRLLGYAPAEIVGQPAARLLADGARDDEDVDQSAGRIPSGQDRWSGTVALRHRDGRRVELRLLAHRWTSTGGNTKWFVVSAVPGEPSVPWGDSLKEWTFAQSPCFLAVFDENLRLVRANAGMERTLSLTESEMRGLRLPEIAPDPVSDETERRMRLVVETGEPQHVDAFVRPAGGRADHGLAASLAPLRDADGRVRAVCLAAHEKTGTDDERPQLLLSDVDTAGIGTSMDSARTAEELADAAVPRIADFAVVDLLEPPRAPTSAPPGRRRGRSPSPTPPCARSSKEAWSPRSRSAGRPSIRRCHLPSSVWPRAAAPCTRPRTRPSPDGWPRTPGPPGSVTPEPTR